MVSENDPYNALINDFSSLLLSLSVEGEGERKKGKKEPLIALPPLTGSSPSKNNARCRQGRRKREGGETLNKMASPYHTFFYSLLTFSIFLEKGKGEEESN